MDKQYKRLGDILKAQKKIDADQLRYALNLQRKKGLSLGKILIQEQLITQEALAKALAFQKNLELVDLVEYEVNPRAVLLVGEELARRHKMMPIDFEDGKLVVALANPLDVHAIDSIQMITGRKIRLVVATEAAINTAINNYMTAPTQIKESVKEATRVSEVDVKLEEINPFEEDVPVVRLANTILSQAFKQRSSDVHIECTEKDIRVRYRVDGVLREAMRLPVRLRSLLVSRFKIMSGMDIAEKRRPQDGRMSLRIDGKEVQIRAATLPSSFGESVVLRILTSSKSLININALGLDEELTNEYRQAFNRPYGAVLVTGPTGSGKTTTLYGVLNELNTFEKKIITIEDPIEYSLDGLTQIQINRKVGLDFAMGLRAIVRADPDIIMVGEIRDLETAQIAIRAALTGHLVLSSLHTNDAPSALTRLVDMGMESFLVASSIQCVLAQRLARLLCPHCKVPVEYDRGQLKDMGFKGNIDNATFFKPGNCGKCQHTGYYGRIGVFELMLLTDEIDKLCLSGRSGAEIKSQAIADGMRTLYEDGMIKAGKGLVSVNEVRRVLT